MGPRMRKSAPVYTPHKPDGRCRDRSGFFVRMEVRDVGVWYGRGGSKKIAECSAAIAGLIDLGIDSLEQHSEQQQQSAAVQPAPPECVRQYPYDDQAKCRLQEHVVGRAMRLPAPKYNVHSIAGSQNDPLFIVRMDIQSTGTWFGSGPNRKHAECSAAVAALIDLRIDKPDQHARKSAAQPIAGSTREAVYAALPLSTPGPLAAVQLTPPLADLLLLLQILLTSQFLKITSALNFSSSMDGRWRELAFSPRSASG